MAMKSYRERDRERESGRSFRDDRERGPDRDRGRDTDVQRHFPYGRPSVSSWIAAASVAFAVFLLGGFIKTYRQLETLEADSRREIASLRDAVRRLQTERFAAPAAERRRAAAPYAESAAPAPLPPAPRPPALSPAGGALSAFEGAGGQDGVRYQWGRTSGAPESRMLKTASGAESQVVSVSAANRRIMIEGGRDVDLVEGARLELCRDGRWIADLRVQDVFGNQSLCEVLHATVTPQPGDTIRMPEKSM